MRPKSGIKTLQRNISVKTQKTFNQKRQGMITFVSAQNDMS